jgi:hypothetical protein
MNDHEQPPDRPATPNPPFQFSIAAMLVLMVFVALACAGVLSESRPLAMVTLATMLASWLSALVVMICYGRGYVRTFGIATIGPAVFATWVSIMIPQLPVHFFGSARFEGLLAFASALGISSIAGCVGMFVRWVIETPLRLPRPREPVNLLRAALPESVQPPEPPVGAPAGEAVVNNTGESADEQQAGEP